MCKCHRVNRETRKTERVAGPSIVGSLLIGERFYFPHEQGIIRHLVERSATDYFCPPVEHSGMDERQRHVFHKRAAIIALSQEVGNGE